MLCCFFIFFFFNDTATTEIYTLSLHDALPISIASVSLSPSSAPGANLVLAICDSPMSVEERLGARRRARSEEHTSELQSQSNLVCRLLLEKKTRITAQSYLVRCCTLNWRWR